MCKQCALVILVVLAVCTSNVRSTSGSSSASMRLGFSTKVSGSWKLWGDSENPWRRSGTSGKPIRFSALEFRKRRRDVHKKSHERHRAEVLFASSAEEVARRNLLFSLVAKSTRSVVPNPRLSPLQRCRTSQMSVSSLLFTLSVSSVCQFRLSFCHLCGIGSLTCAGASNFSPLPGTPRQLRSLDQLRCFFRPLLRSTWMSLDRAPWTAS